MNRQGWRLRTGNSGRNFFAKRLNLRAIESEPPLLEVGEWQREARALRIRVYLLSILILSATFQAHAQTQVDPFELAQLTCAALVAAVKKTPIPDYLDQSENPNFFVMLRRHEPLYNKCMAACAGPVFVRDCAIRGQPPAVIARLQQILNSSAEDTIEKARERLRKGQ